MTLINRYLESLNIDIESRCMLGEYLKLVSKRAKGNLLITINNSILYKLLINKLTQIR